MSSNRVETFMDSCLVAWVKTFDEPVTSVKDLASGVIFNKIMNTIDPNTYGMTRVNQRVGEDVQLRLQNLHLACNYIHHFYFTILKQLIITALPDVVSIAHEPSSDKSLEEIEKMIVLLLGCAVQCENKATLIQKMMAMEQQRGLVPYIQQMTDTTQFVCALDWTDLEDYPKADLEVLCKSAYVHLQRVAKERNELFDTIVETTQEVDFYRAHQAAGTPGKTALSPEVNLELIEAKKQARNLRDQLDRAMDKNVVLQEELTHTRSSLQQLQSENQILLEESKSMRVYRDEVEALQLKTAKLEQLESEVTRYRQKVEDAEYLKKRVQELKQETELVNDTKTLLEQKAATLASRAEAADELQSELASLKVRLDAITQEKEMDNTRIDELVGENARLELENKSNQEQINQLMSELQTERERMAGVVGTTSSETNLGAEMTEVELAQRAKLLRLEKSNREMEKQLSNLRHSQAKLSELERTNKKLYSQNHDDKRAIIKLKEEVEMLKVKASRVDKLQTELGSHRDKLEEASRLQIRLREMKAKSEQVLEAKAMLEDEVESLQDKVATLDDMKSENAHLKAQVESLTEEHTEDERHLQELLEQNAQLELEKQTMSEQVKALTNEVGKTKGGASPARVQYISPPRAEVDLAQKARLQRLEKETKEMEKSMEAYRHSQAKITELEKTNKKLQKQTHADRKEIVRLKEELQSFKTKTSRLEKQKIVMKTQTSQIEEAEAADRKIMELKQQNILLSETKALLEEEVGSLHQKLDGLGELQADNAALKVRVDTLEQEMADESERMQSLLQENAQFELEKDKDTAKIESLQTEVERLRTSALKPSNPEDSTSRSSVMSESEMEMRAKVLHLERDHRELQRTFDLYKQRTERASKELEKTNQKMNAQNHNDKKELVRLKEELKRSKAELSKLTSQMDDLQKSPGIPVTPAEGAEFHELGARFGEAYSKSLATKEERISTLERRLEETTKDNQLLRDEVASVRKQLGRSPSSAGQTSNSPLSRSRNARDFVRLREQAEESGRLKEKNAHLMADLADCRNVIHQHQHTISTQKQNVEMLELLNHTLEEEKKTLLMQVNKLLEQNQSLLMKTIENRDTALEDERMFSDRLTELQRDKARLSDQLINQQREAMNREIQLMKKREKSKSLIKRGLKKLRGTFKGERTWHFQPDEGTLQPPAAQSIATTSSPHHTTIRPPSFLHNNDGSCSSSQSISSAEHTDSREDLDLANFDVHGFVPRGPTLDHNSPVTLRQKRQLKTQSMYLPAKPDPASSHFHSDQPEEIVSLLDFLDETNKRPNRRKHMEIKRASMIGTPPMTPRNSVLFPLNQSQTSNASSGDQVDLQKILQEFQVDDTMSIPEVEETESDQHQKEEGEAGKMTTPIGSFSSASGTTTPEEIPQLNLNSNSNNNSPFLHRSAMADSPRSLDEAVGDHSIDCSSPSSSEATGVTARWMVPVRIGDDDDDDEGEEQAGGGGGGGGIPKSRSAGDVLDEQWTDSRPHKSSSPPAATKSARKSLFSSFGDLTGGKRRSRINQKINKSSENLTAEAKKPEPKYRERSKSLFSSRQQPPAQVKTRNKSGDHKRGFSRWRKSTQSIPAEAPLPTLPEVPQNLSQEMLAFAYDALSQPLPLESLTCPPASTSGSQWNEYGFVQ